MAWRRKVSRLYCIADKSSWLRSRKSARRLRDALPPTPSADVQTHLDGRLGANELFGRIDPKDVRQGPHGREILMHRGVGKQEWRKFVHEREFRTDALTSWTTDWHVAQTFGSRRQGFTVSAWIPQTFIHAIPAQQDEAFKPEAEYVVRPGSFEIQQAFRSQDRKRIL